MVVDALDLCYTKEHIDTFVIISGDSDFSPLVSKLRENAKNVIGVGVKNSTSDLLMNNCDEFIFYDDLVRASDTTKSRKRGSSRNPSTASGAAKKAQPPASKSGDDKNGGSADEAIELLMETAEALSAERGDPVWGSMVKQTLKRRRPGFNESYYGFRAFADLLEEAEDRGLLDLELDERSGGYLIRTGKRKD